MGQACLYTKYGCGLLQAILGLSPYGASGSRLFPQHPKRLLNGHSQVFTNSARCFSSLSSHQKASSLSKRFTSNFATTCSDVDAESDQAAKLVAELFSNPDLRDGYRSPKKRRKENTEVKAQEGQLLSTATSVDNKTQTTSNSNTLSRRPPPQNPRQAVSLSISEPAKPFDSNDLLPSSKSSSPLSSSSSSSQTNSKPLPPLPSKPLPWQRQKHAIARKHSTATWSPRKRLSPDALSGIRALHEHDREKYSTPMLAEQFKVSPEVIRRILKSKWEPNEEEMADRRRRWERRGERVWENKRALGLRQESWEERMKGKEKKARKTIRTEKKTEEEIEPVWL